MSYDREEWRRPWRPGDPPASWSGTAAPGAVGDAAPTDPTGAVGEDAGAGAADPRWATTSSADPAGPTSQAYRFPRPSSVEAAGAGAPPPQVDRTAPAAPPRRRVLPAIVGAMVSGAVGALVALAVTGAFDEPTPPPAVEATGDDADGPADLPLQEGTSIVPEVADAVTPSVVRVDVSAGDAVRMPGLGGGLGSGVIYTDDGYILTNHHVIDSAGEVTVRLADGDILEAEVVGSDELNDIAVLKVERTGLPAIEIRGEDEPLRVGETVVAIGSPFGLDASVSAGIISALDREIRLDEPAEGAGVLTIPSVVQTDAAINPGNSGGALVDSRGRLVGINTAILTGTGANQGVGFAVSAQQARASADQLIEQGFVRHPLLGIAGSDVRPEQAERLGLSSPRGAVVEVVEEDSGAAEVDLRPGDVIVEVDGEPLATMSELVAEVRRREPGDIVTLEVVRDGEVFEVDVELGERPR